MKDTLNVLLSKLRMKQLQLLIALDDLKSLHKAAGAMSMTQSAASKALQELESMLDAPLFERSKTGMIPNQLGHCVIRYARLVATDLTALCQDVAEIRSGRGGRLAVGAIMGAIPACVVPALNQLHTGQPNLSIEVVEDTSARMLPQLDDGRLDLVVGRAAVAADPSKYHYWPLADEPLSVVVGYGHAPWSKKEVKLGDLAGYRWVMYPSHMPLHALLEREMDLAGLTMPDNPISTASTFVTVALLQSSTDLVSLLPTAIADLFVRQKMLRAVPVRLKSPSQTFGVVTRKGGVLSPPAEQFIELLRAQAAVHVVENLPLNAALKSTQKQPPQKQKTA
jgi:DNA-binding transcriptional LysR family regulator